MCYLIVMEPTPWYADPKFWMSLGALLISAISAGFTTWAWFRTLRNQRHLVGIEQAREKDRVRQTQKARVIARFEKELDSRGKPRKVLVIENTGASEARGIDVRVDDVPLSELLNKVVLGDKIADRIGPGAQARYPTVPVLGALPPWDIEITWDDDSGEREAFRTTLTG